MGSPKQAAALVKLDAKYRAHKGIPPATSAENDSFYQRILTMPLADIQRLFAAVNEVTGFDRHISPATRDQRKRMAQLEVANFGKVRTTSRDPLTFIEASDYITELADMRTVTNAAVREVEEFANLQPAEAARVAP